MRQTSIYVSYTMIVTYNNNHSSLTPVNPFPKSFAHPSNRALSRLMETHFLVLIAPRSSARKAVAAQPGSRHPSSGSITRASPGDAQPPPLRSVFALSSLPCPLFPIIFPTLLPIPLDKRCPTHGRDGREGTKAEGNSGGQAATADVMMEQQTKNSRQPAAETGHTECLPKQGKGAGEECRSQHIRHILHDI